jgi:sulfate transporter 3
VHCVSLFFFCICCYIYTPSLSTLVYLIYPSSSCMSSAITYHTMVGMRVPYGGSYNNGSNESQLLGSAAEPAPEVPAMMEVHKVVTPPPQSTASKLKVRVKETLFPDDPFRGFKGQPRMVQWLLALKYLFPILDWLPTYSFSLFKSDLIAGLTIASLAIPQA